MGRRGRGVRQARPAREDHDVRGAREARRARRGRSARDRGQVAIEYLGFIPILILVALAGVQLGLVAYAAQQAGTAARAGARAASLDPGGAQEGCQTAVSGWLADGTDCGEAYGADEVTVTATVQIPSVVPGWDFDPAQKTATMPLDFDPTDG